MGRAAALIALALAGVAFVPGCSEKVQLVVVIDTDLATPKILRDDPMASRAAGIDRLDIQLLNERNEYNALRPGKNAQIFTLSDTTEWPLSFGVQRDDDKVARIWIRAYRDGPTTRVREGPGLNPGRLEIDRFVVVDLPESDDTIHVVLRGDCLGIYTDFKANRTCVTGPDDMRDVREAFERGEAPSSIAGSWSRLHRLPCTSASPFDAVCIPGGLSVRGDPAFEAVDQALGQVPTRRSHYVHLRPFFLDRTEVTVKRFRAAHAKLGSVRPPDVASEKQPACTWTQAAGANEDLPLTCVDFETARALCRADGGDLPTDAQWEHAARGPTVTPRYVWGDSDARCCASRIATYLGCAEARPAVPGTYTDRSSCEGRADTTADGVVDLAGNVREMVLDSAFEYGGRECPLAGIMTDPLCDVKDAPHAARGGSFRSTFELARNGVRTTTKLADDLGFRCAYPEPR